jgi:predicted secreted protein
MNKRREIMKFGNGRTAVVLMVMTIIGIWTLAPGNVMSQKKDMVITDRDNGKTACLPVGSIFTVKLTGQLGTGYTWTVVSQARNILAPVGSPRFEEAKRNLPGGKAYQIFQFKAVGKGNGILELRYGRPWEKKAPPVRSFKIRVEVAEGQCPFWWLFLVDPHLRR